MKNNKDSFYTLFSAFGVIIFLVFGLPFIISNSFNTDDYEITTSKIYGTTSYTFYDFDYEYEPLPSLDFSIPELISSEISSYQPPKEENKTIVYVTEYGSKYHQITCGSLYNSAYPMELNEAFEDGYGPCSRCHPPLPDFD